MTRARRASAPAAVEGARQGGDPRHRCHRAADRLRQQRPARRHAGVSSARLSLSVTALRRASAASSSPTMTMPIAPPSGQASRRRRGHAWSTAARIPRATSSRRPDAPASRSLPAAWCLAVESTARRPGDRSGARRCFPGGQSRRAAAKAGCLRFRRHVRRLQPGRPSVVPQWRQDSLRRRSFTPSARPPSRPHLGSGRRQRDLR